MYLIKNDLLDLRTTLPYLRTGVFSKGTQGKFFAKKVVGCFDKIPKLSGYFFDDDFVGGVGGAHCSSLKEPNFRRVIIRTIEKVPERETIFAVTWGVLWRLFWGKLIVKNENFKLIKPSVPMHQSKTVNFG